MFHKHMVIAVVDAKPCFTATWL